MSDIAVLEHYLEKSQEWVAVAFIGADRTEWGSECRSGDKLRIRYLNRPAWVAINKMTDAPDHDCTVAYTFIDEQVPGDILDDLSNLGASVGFLSWSRDKTFWSIHEDGEVVVSTQVTALCEIPTPMRVIAGTGAEEPPRNR